MCPWIQVLVLKESKPGSACVAVLSWSPERDEAEWTNMEFKAQRIPALSIQTALPTRYFETKLTLQMQMTHPLELGF